MSKVIDVQTATATVATKNRVGQLFELMSCWRAPTNEKQLIVQCVIRGLLFFPQVNEKQS